VGRGSLTTIIYKLLSPYVVRASVERHHRVDMKAVASVGKAHATAVLAAARSDDTLHKLVARFNQFARMKIL
jgi:hypothetical protein